MAISLSLSETSPAQWKYISEGGATIVFSYNGPLHPILTGKVLRLRKTSRKPEALRISDDQGIIFQQKIISRLLDSSYFPELQVVALQVAWLQAFSVHHESFRPQKRRSVNMIDCSRCTGVLALDLIGGLSCAVEVKVNGHSSSREYPTDNFSKAEMGFPAQFYPLVTREQADQNSYMQDLYARSLEADRRRDCGNAILPTRSVFRIEGAHRGRHWRPLGLLGTIQWFYQQPSHLQSWKNGASE